jgi:peptide/nickel transport system permease protein
MTAYLFRRVLHSIGVTAAVLTLVFFAGRVVGDPVRLVLGIEAEEARIQRVRDSLHLNDPLLVQYARFAAGAVRGDFGDSFWQKTPALPLVLERVPATLYLAAVALLLILPLAITLGTVAALRPRSVVDRVINVISLGGVSIVEFWLALMLILVFAVELGWFRTSGYGGLRFVILPALALAYKPLGRISQVTRSAMLEALRKPYIKAARAKGLSERRVVYLHGLKNAAIPIITISGDELISLIGGAIVIETVFGWPGIGLLTIQALERRDLPLIEATVFVTALMVILTNLFVDITYTYLNPRIRFE